MEHPSVLRDDSVQHNETHVLGHSGQVFGYNLIHLNLQFLDKVQEYNHLEKNMINRHKM